MLTFPIPDIMLKSIYELRPDKLSEMGVKLLLMDLDNTLDKYHARYPRVRLRNWIDGMKRAGVEPFIYSNSSGKRAERFASSLSIEYVNKAKKPGVKRLFRLLGEKNVTPENTAIIGDQIYTDILCGKRAGLTTIAVTPIDMSNPFYFLRYGAELPFRFAYNKRGNIKKKKD
ncbi:MAG: YqeG family HAD IIIA-type phosphatase [Oscillospiraceae bacterium]|nr:YqeG family HAD IIIA-type phosphatase [Oscillospiraceae bacterium]